ncbi:hypothetical protein ACFC18_31020 [Streptomyces sp. NPDC056121]|uniref:hypothetical protein n=1 Tax=Streptomyces sp. NPDC056121 TaxID=3345718 RepID=UPI0035D86F39
MVDVGPEGKGRQVLGSISLTQMGKADSVARDVDTEAAVQLGSRSAPRPQCGQSQSALDGEEGAADVIAPNDDSFGLAVAHAHPFITDGGA